MLDPLRRALVESYVGAVGLGYSLAQLILHFVNIFASPVAGWLARKEYRGLTSNPSPTGFSLRDALPETVRFLFLLAAWFALLRWLYMPKKPATSTEAE